MHDTLYHVESATMKAQHVVHNALACLILRSNSGLLVRNMPSIPPSNPYVPVFNKPTIPSTRPMTARVCRVSLFTRTSSTCLRRSGLVCRQSSFQKDVYPYGRVLVANVSCKCRDPDGLCSCPDTIALETSDNKAVSSGGSGADFVTIF